MRASQAGLVPGQGPNQPERGETKSDASHRTIGMPTELTSLLRAHRTQQLAMRMQAADQWVEGDWVFTDEVGQPLNNIGDYRRWKALIKEAGVRDARLHDARHTAATTLLLLGVSERGVIDMMGWSTGKMTLVYQHITDSVRKDVAAKVGGFSWGSGDPPDRLCNAAPAASLAPLRRPDRCRRTGADSHNRRASAAGEVRPRVPSAAKRPSRVVLGRSASRCHGGGGGI